MSTSIASKLPCYDHYFSDPPLTRAFYIPTDPLKLSYEQKLIALSPQRIPEKESGVQQSITPETAAYLRTNNVFDCDKILPQHETPSPSSTEKYNESWPSTTNHYSSPGDTSLPAASTTPVTTANDTQAVGDSTEEGVLSKYLRRFRCDPPRRREERRQPSLAEFWWGSRSNHTATALTTPRKLSHDAADSYRSDEATCNSDLSSVTISSSRAGSKSEVKGQRMAADTPQTPHTKALLDKTSRLLSNSAVSSQVSESSPPLISSDGVNNTADSSSPASLSTRIYHSTPEEVVREVSVRPVLHRAGRAPAKATLADDDILYQWRLKRRMESARQRVHDAERAAADAKSTPEDLRRQYIQQQRVEVVADSNRCSHEKNRELPSPAADHFASKLCHQQVCTELPHQSTNQSRVQTVVERLVQTDPELKPVTTQTTPTIDPLTDLNIVSSKMEAQLQRSEVSQCKRSHPPSPSNAEPSRENTGDTQLDTCTPVSHAIRQVTGHRLFAASPPVSSPCSSPQRTEADNSENKSPLYKDGNVNTNTAAVLSQPSESAVSTSDDDADRDDSDGEHSDDSLLQELRARRHALLSKLRRLEDLRRNKQPL